MDLVSSTRAEYHARQLSLKHPKGMVIVQYVYGSITVYAELYDSKSIGVSKLKKLIPVGWKSVYSCAAPALTPHLHFVAQ